MKSEKPVFYSSESVQNTYEMEMTEEDLSKILVEQKKTEEISTHLFLASGSHDKGKTMFRVAFSHRMASNEWARLLNAVEPVDPVLAYSQGFYWPLDYLSMIESRDVHCYILPQINQSKFIPVHKYLYDPKVRRWDIAISLFARLNRLKHLDLTLNGFGWENIYVNRDTNEVLLFPGFYVSDGKGRSSYFYDDGFLAVPSRLGVAEESPAKFRGYSVSTPIRGDESEHVNSATFLTQGVARDIFSAATLSFMLLYFTHPFIGGRFWSLSREEYLKQYMHFPDYIFDETKEAPSYISENAVERNFLTYLDFENAIKEEYAKITPDLKKLFQEFFTCCTHPERFEKEKPYYLLNPQNWIAALREDAEVNDRPEKLSSYDFSAVQNYQV